MWSRVILFSFLLGLLGLTCWGQTVRANGEPILKLDGVTEEIDPFIAPFPHYVSGYWVYDVTVVRPGQNSHSSDHIETGEYRVEVKNGKMISGDSRLFSNPIPTLNLRHYYGEWYRFPMKVGTTFSGEFFGNRWRYYNVAVLRAVKIDGFKALELSRERKDGGLYTVYAYSPKALSAVRAITERWHNGELVFRIRHRLRDYSVSWGAKVAGR
jgi:hypothetical protein